MATLHAPTVQTRSRLRGSTHGIRSMSERQLDAYLQTRDTLRRLRAVAALTVDMRQSAAPSSPVCDTLQPDSPAGG